MSHDEPPPMRDRPVLPLPPGTAGPELFRFDGRTVLVTGAAGAFGRATALAFARSGARLFLTDIAAAGLRESVAAVKREDFECAAHVGDISEPEDVERVFERLDATYGGVDVLVNNAAVNPHQDVPEDFPLEVWNRVLATNLTGYLLCAQQAARRMIASGTGGTIVNVSSIAAISALGRGNLAFGVSKAGVEQITRELAVAWAVHGIRVNAVRPCQFVGSGLENLGTTPETRQLLNRMLAGIPAGRLGIPDEVAGPILFLASDAASMITGAVLPIDGGNQAVNAGGSFAGA